ncbi:hypothetical protein MO973_40605 [Paenibacillus sp. TRM 82003]|nr:hypothetical protein [Paenibacillus sp. TRM 82003]
MSSFQRPPVRVFSPGDRASRWADRSIAESWTTEVLRAHEARVRRAASLRVPWIELRLPAPASIGTLLVRAGADVSERAITCVVVRLDLSGRAPRLLASFPEDLPVEGGRWELLQLLAATAPTATEDWLDPRASLDALLTADPATATAALEQWRAASATAAGPADVVAAVTGAADGPPEGVSWAVWGEWFERRLEEGPASSPVREAPALHRTGRFDPTTPVGDLVSAVLEARADALERWLADPHASRRLRVVVDLGRSVGSVELTQPAVSVASQHVAVVLQRASGSAPLVLDAHPELPPGDSAHRFPHLSGVLAAYTGPAMERLDAQPWPAQQALLRQEPPGVVDDLVAELEDLDRLDEDAVRAAVLGAGSAVLPDDPRGWLHRLRWRAQSFPWRGEG